MMKEFLGLYGPYLEIGSVFECPIPNPFWNQGFWLVPDDIEDGQKQPCWVIDGLLTLPRLVVGDKDSGY